MKLFGKKINILKALKKFLKCCNNIGIPTRLLKNKLNINKFIKTFAVLLPRAC